jgi:hypothetical protein
VVAGDVHEGSMSQIIDTAARLIAFAERRAIPIRSSSALAPDPVPTFGIAPIRVVAEQFVQAIAYGDLDRTPQVVVSWNPLDRDASFLEPFAFALDAYLQTCVEARQLPRVWLPHGAALEVIDILGHRYRTNRSANDVLQRLGAQCRLLADEASFGGQQLVAIASDVLASHLVTGQSPSEDRHLAALLVWVSPPAGVDPAEEAARQALMPAAAMLERADDDNVEALRQQVWERRVTVAEARPQVEQILRAAALREWELLVQARQAFWQLGLPAGAELDALVQTSLGRIAWQVDRNLNAPSRPNSLAGLLDDMSFAQNQAEFVDVSADAIVRERRLRAGTIVRGEVVRVEQARAGFRPCELTLRTTQPVLRLRAGSMLQLVGARVRGRVLALREQGNGTTLVTLEVVEGVRYRPFPQVGTSGDWSEPEPVDLRKRRRDIYAHMAEAQDPRVYGEALPPETPRQLNDDIGEIARRLRKA